MLLTTVERKRMLVELKLANITVSKNIRSDKLIKVHTCYVVDGKKYIRGIYGININGHTKTTKSRKQIAEERKKKEALKTCKIDPGD